MDFGIRFIRGGKPKTLRVTEDVFTQWNLLPNAFNPSKLCINALLIAHLNSRTTSSTIGTFKSKNALIFEETESVSYFVLNHEYCKAGKMGGK